MSVRAKFTCNAVVPTHWNPKDVNVYFNAVYGTEGENADYSKYTPSGHINMVISESTPAVEFFKQGKNYKVTFEECE